MVAVAQFTLADVANRLGVAQHRLIHLCEKGVIAPEVEDAHGRGSSRVFSARNLLEFAIALRLRGAMLPVAAVGAVLHVLRAFEGSLQRELPGFSLPESVRENAAPDLRIIVSDGSIIYFLLGRAGNEAKLFGGVPLDQITGDKPASIKAATLEARPAGKSAGANGFGEPEGSRFVRLELSVTEIAQDLPMD